MSKGRHRRTSGLPASGTKPSPSYTVKFESYEQVFIGPLISTIIAFGIYLCKLYWEKFPNIGFFETVVVAVCLFGICLFLLYLPHLLYGAFSNKCYAAVAVVVVFLIITTLGGPIWKFFVLETNPLNSTFNSTEHDELGHPSKQVMNLGQAEQQAQPTSKPEQQAQPTSKSEQHAQPTSKPEQQAQPTSKSEQQAQPTSKSEQQAQPTSKTEQQAQPTSKSEQQAQPTSKTEQQAQPTSKSGESFSTIEFDGDCRKYSRQLLSQTVLNYTKRHHIKGQVEMFERTIHLTGKPSFLVISGNPSEYEGDALDVMERHHNAGARSYVSVKDAVEKSLIHMCENLRREGFGKH